jgi:hypothetical protein
VLLRNLHITVIMPSPSLNFQGSAPNPSPHTHCLLILLIHPALYILPHFTIPAAIGGLHKSLSSSLCNGLNCSLKPLQVQILILPERERERRRRTMGRMEYVCVGTKGQVERYLPLNAPLLVQPLRIGALYYLRKLVQSET